MTITSDTEKVRDQWLRYIYCRDNGHIDFVKKSDKCEDFFAGLQWDPIDLARLNQQRRPALTINKILSTLETVFGEQIENRVEVSLQPKHGSPQETAQALNAVWTHISQQNQLQWVRSDVFCDGIIRSRGFFEARLNFDQNVFGEVEITNLNPKNVVIDPDAEDYDPDRWGDVIVTRWLSPNDIAVTHGKDKAEALKNREGSEFMWGFDSVEVTRERFSGRGITPRDLNSDKDTMVQRYIRVLDRQYHVLDRVEHFVDPRSGEMRAIPTGWDRDRVALTIQKYGLLTTNKLVKRVRWCVTADDILLHDDWSPYKHFTVVPYFPHFRYGRTIGKVENLLGPQELLNKSVSQELHVINTTANSGWKLKSGSLQNMTVEELESRGAQTGIVLELEDTSDAEKIQPNSVPSGLDRLSYKAEEYIKGVSSVSDSMQGFDREDVAAKAIAAKQQRGAVSLVKPLDNLQRTDWILARNTIDMVQVFYSSERSMRITKNAFTGDVEEITVNRETPEGTIESDLTVGEYDIVITSVPARATLEDSQFEQAVGLRELGVPIPDSVLVENSRLHRKREIIKQMEGDKTSPEARAQAELQQRAFQAEVASTEAEVGQKQADALLKQAKAQKEAQQDGAAELELKAAEAEQKIQLEREKTANDIMLRREELAAELEMERQKQAAEERRANERHDMEMSRALLDSATSEESTTEE